eukprot:CAMPEP_0184866736 /NCGR_PEP_ID=MMETSP0580-20130426/23504_1 /TAXON_ID=1118495 /ORGANISM="Dactyliosolen fragilissimus" /LENGTH=171 /DNA_ID=CAMNT_0027366577 /DNA_START=790 /DNA_END=1306 /DNA_ORIENTATION=+
MKRECSSGYCGKKDCRFFAKWCSTRFKKGFTPQSMGCGCKKGEKTCPNGACVRDGGCCPDESCEGCGYCCPTKTKINFICCKGKTNKCIPDGNAAQKNVVVKVSKESAAMVIAAQINTSVLRQTFTVTANFVVSMVVLGVQATVQNAVQKTKHVFQTMIVVRVNWNAMKDV